MVVSSSKDSELSYRVKTAMKYGIPVVSVDFIDACIASGKLLDTDDFVLLGERASTSFSSGKILSSGTSQILLYCKA